MKRACKLPMSKNYELKIIDLRGNKIMLCEFHTVIKKQIIYT